MKWPSLLFAIINWVKRFPIPIKLPRLSGVGTFTIGPPTNLETFTIGPCTPCGKVLLEHFNVLIVHCFVQELTLQRKTWRLILG